MYDSQRRSLQPTSDGPRLNFDVVTEEECFLLFRYDLKKIGKLDRYDIRSKVNSGYISRMRYRYAQIADF